MKENNIYKYITITQGIINWAERGQRKRNLSVCMSVCALKRKTSSEIDINICTDVLRVERRFVMHFEFEFNLSNIVTPWQALDMPWPRGQKVKEWIRVTVWVCMSIHMYIFLHRAKEHCSQI